MPHATQILADLGAEVLKVEPPGGDPMRAYPEIFASVGRGKRSVVIDLRTDEGRARAHQLVAEADVVCESWRPGVADRLGVGYDTVRGLHPEVIYCSLSGFGQDGPLRDVPGHDVNFQALAGALAPRAGADPQVPRLPVADLEGGTVCALLICAAWARRLTTGAGERIDVAMADVVAWWVGPSSGTVHVDVEGPTAGSPGYGVFRARDGGWVALGVLGEPRLWDAICRALELDTLAGLAFDERLARAAEVDAAVAGAVGRRDRDDVLARLVECGAPATPVLAPEETTAHAQIRERGFHVESDAGLVAGLPARLGSGGRIAPTHVPAVGEHPEGFTPR
jgi:crotonobetainyl-CoA:carnitine CoA-transferase CaiB-like acyl-CoA transferase